MLTYIVRRAAVSIVVLIIITLITFTFMRVVGDPVHVILGRGAAATEATVQRLRHTLGLDRPMGIQYLNWVGEAVQGNLGRSFRSPISVTSALLARLPATFELMLLALSIAFVTGTALGITAGLRAGSKLDTMLSTFAAVSLTIPNFWLGILLIYFFALRLGWLPSAGYVPFLQKPMENLRYMVLPTITLAAFYVGSYMRYARALMIDIWSRDYIRTAKAKGLSSRVTLLRHALRNALIPLVTLVGLDIAGLVGGAVVTEAVFAIPGVGTLLTDSILSGDLPMVQGIVLFVTVMVVVVNFTLDLLYGYLDPQARVLHG